MQLKEYLETSGILPKEFARETDIGLQNLYYWMRGRFKPNKFYQNLIKKATKGKVTEKDWNK